LENDLAFCSALSNKRSLGMNKAILFPWFGFVRTFLFRRRTNMIATGGAASHKILFLLIL
jgi:hypothetical protein